MRPALHTLIPILICCVFGLTTHLCGATAKDLTGTWILDPNAAWEQIRKLRVTRAMTAPQVEQAKQEMLAEFAKGVVRVVITADRMTMTMGKSDAGALPEEREEFRYRIVGEADSVFTVEMESIAEPEETATKETVTLILKDGLMTMGGLGENGFVLRRIDDQGVKP